MELTLNNLTELLNNSEFTIEEILEHPGPKGKNLNIYIKTLNSLLESFFPEYESKKVIPVNKLPIYSGGSVLHMEKIFEKKVFKNVTKFTFKHFYAHIISKLFSIERSDYFKEIDPYGEEDWEDPSLGEFFNKKLDLNLKEFPILYKFILDNFENIKNNENKKVLCLTRLLLNYTYGTLTANNSFLRSTNPGIIPEAGRKIMNSFINQFPDNILYVDTDIIIFINYKDIEDEVKEKLKDINILYETKDYLYFIPLEKKHYILSENEIERCGFVGEIENLKEYRIKLEKSKETIRKKLEQRIINGESVYDRLYPRGVIQGTI
jgi:hypothetical protein